MMVTSSHPRNSVGKLGEKPHEANDIIAEIARST